MIDRFIICFGTMCNNNNNNIRQDQMISYSVLSERPRCNLNSLIVNLKKSTLPTLL